jgi:hypothetical protein
VSLNPARLAFPFGSRRNIPPVLGKGRRNTRRGTGSDPLAKAGLTDDRLALVHRYMLHSEEVEAEAQAGTETEPPEAAPTLSQPERELRAEDLFTRIDTAEPQVEKVDLDEPRPSTKERAETPEPLSKADKRAAKEAARRFAALEKKEARERKALAKARRKN